MNQLQDDLKRKLQELENSRCELDILRYQMPPSNRMLAVESRISATEAEMEELEERKTEVKAIIADYGRKSRNIMKAISEYLDEYQTMKDSEAAQLEVLQNEMVALEKKLITMTEAKDDEIKSCKIRLKHQRIKLTTEHTAVCEKQERHFMKRLREIEGRCQKALRSAETQHVAELRSKNQKIENLESKVQKLEAQLLVHQSSVQNKLKNLFKRKKSVSVDESKRRGTAQKGYRGRGLKSDSKYPIHQTKEHDQASHVSTISPPFSYDQYSLRSLPAMHFREILEQNQDQSIPY
jgi:chromosome segregation ATPase